MYRLLFLACCSGCLLAGVPFCMWLSFLRKQHVISWYIQLRGLNRLVFLSSHCFQPTRSVFHGFSCSDLMPELQGRLPIRVQLDPLTEADFRRILTEPKYNVRALPLCLSAPLCLSWMVWGCLLGEQCACDLAQVFCNLHGISCHTLFPFLLQLWPSMLLFLWNCSLQTPF
mgnify:CR=1 FL=1